MKNFVEEGKTIEYTVTGTAVKSGDVVVVSDMVGVAVTDGAIDETIALSVQGVYELTKGPGAIAQGAKAYANVAAGVTTIVAAEAGNSYCGNAWESANAAAKTILVKLN